MLLNIYAMEPHKLEEWLTIRNTVDENAISAGLLKIGGEAASPLTVAGDTAHISVTGPLSKSGPSIIDRIFGFGGTSYGSIISALAEAEANPDVKQIALHIDSPGGEANGVDEVYQAIAACKKPTTAINVGMMASAAYWLACGAQTIVSSSPANQTGSIGVIIAGWDVSKAAESMGFKRMVIVSRNAPKKDQSGYAGAGIEALQERADSLERVFIARVAAGRDTTSADVIAKYGQGSVFVSEDPDAKKPSALSVGMIDGLTPGSAIDNSTETREPQGAKAQVTIPAASAGKQTEGNMGKLEELMATDPALAAEVNAALAKARADGEQAEKSVIVARIGKAKAYLGNTEYPQAVSDLAVSVIAGDVSPDALTTTVIAIDAIKEENKSKGVQAAQPEPTPPTPAGASVGVSKEFAESGTVTTDADIEALLQEVRI